MMGGGLCWLDYDDDGWLDLFVVNNFAESDIGAWDRARRASSQRALPERSRALRERHSSGARRVSPFAARAVSPPT